MKSILDKYSKQAPLIKFAINGLILFILWLIFYQFLRYSQFVNQFYEFSTNWLTSKLLIASKLALNIFGFDVEILGKTIRIVNTGGVYLDRGCLGRNAMGLFAGFIMAYPGKIKHKLWYIPAGLLIINIINVARIAGLAYIVLDFPQYVDINHHIIFKYTVYTFIFILWYLWIKFYSNSFNYKSEASVRTEIKQKNQD